MNWSYKTKLISAIANSQSSLMQSMYFFVIMPTMKHPSKGKLFKQRFKKHFKECSSFIKQHKKLDNLESVLNFLQAVELN